MNKESTESPEIKNIEVTPQLSISSIEELKKIKQDIKGKIIQLPSGLRLKVGRLNLTNLLKTGKIPQNLVNIAVKQQSGIAMSSQKDITESIELFEFLVLEAVKEPKLVRENADVDKGEIDLSFLSDEDKIFIFNYIQKGVVDSYQNFRNERPTNANGGLDMQTIPGKKTE